MNIEELRQRFVSTDWPQFSDAHLSENKCVIGLDIHPDITWFRGHFPEQPILAGVVQTHWAAELGKFLFPLGEDIIRMDNLKFQTVILPGQALSLALEYLPDSNSLKFAYTGNGFNFSEGKFVFAREQVKE